MQVDPHRLRVDVRVRHVGVDAGVHAHGPGRRPPLARELGDRLAEQLDVELEPERRDMARLLGAQEVARAADLEVAHRDREAGAELGVVGKGREAGARFRRQLGRVRIEEVGVRQLVGAAHPPADLVELSEPERVGPLDDQRVGLRDVEARFDDRRRDEHVGVAAQEREHPVLELLLPHLPVSDDQAEVRRKRLEPRGPLVDRLDPVVEEEGLAAACDLPLEGLLDQVLVELADVRPDRAPALGRRLDDRDVPQARERHVERARDRRRREGEDVDLEAQLAQELLLGDAEALLLVDDHEPEVLRDHVSREHPMRPDQDVNFSLCEVGEHLLRLLGAAEARDHLDA